MSENAKGLLATLAVLVVLVLLFPTIWKVALVILAIVAVFFLVVYVRSRSLKKEIDKDPEAYFTAQDMMRQAEKQKQAVSPQVIDAEYREKEVQPEEEK
jgi:membrane protein implicated in regulation of membrane protease activity